MKLASTLFALVFAVSSATALAHGYPTCESSRGGWDDSCNSSCWGYCYGYYYNEYNYFNPNCANVCCTR